MSIERRLTQTGRSMAPVGTHPPEVREALRVASALPSGWRGTFCHTAADAVAITAAAAEVLDLQTRARAERRLVRVTGRHWGGVVEQR